MSQILSLIAVLFFGCAVLFLILVCIIFISGKIADVLGRSFQLDSYAASLFSLPITIGGFGIVFYIASKVVSL